MSGRCAHLYGQDTVNLEPGQTILVPRYVVHQARAVGDETMPRMNVLLDDLSKETHALGRVINTLGEHPQSIVFGAPPGRPGPGEPGFAGRR